MYLLTDRLAHEAQKQWAEEDQINMVIEECGELIVAIQHLKRGRVGIEAVIEEITDVGIMLDQMETIFQSHLKDAPEVFSRIETQKLDRLKVRVGLSDVNERGEK